MISLVYCSIMYVDALILNGLEYVRCSFKIIDFEHFKLICLFIDNFTLLANVLSSIQNEQLEKAHNTSKHLTTNLTRL